MCIVLSEVFIYVAYIILVYMYLATYVHVCMYMLETAAM